ncbi:hypothetical protein VTN00DRAFT_2585 [Thermoascus crustaceus]|uniref:uncharacterized protein n=1 Tax=Thermoascus crustaceus TaxID=5088 RepID=UPI0037432471
MPSLADPVKLPCGLVLPNRFVKAAMAEQLSPDGAPNEDFIQAYSRWAEGGWGALLTGNVHVDINHLGSPRDPAAPGTSHGGEFDPEALAIWRRYADACQKHGTPGIVQVCHPGRQSPLGAGRRGFFAKSLAPSAVPIKIGDGLLAYFLGALLFGTPREMTVAEIENVVRQFVDTARLMKESGFMGIELHGAHGYLIDQFLSPKTNRRTDAYGGTPEKRAKFVLDIITQTRQAVGPNFCIGIKLNSADHDAADFEDTMRQIELLVEVGIDFLEISGGSLENPQMMGYNIKTSSRTAAREAFFLDFATETRKRFPHLLLMLTGGIRSRQGAKAVVSDGACDLVGIGRPACVNPSFPKLLLDVAGTPDEKARLPLAKAPLPGWAKLIPLKILGAGAESMFYVGQIYRLAKGLATFGPKV